MQPITKSNVSEQKELWILFPFSKKKNGVCAAVQ